jgi:hypothetical protein
MQSFNPEKLYETLQKNAAESSDPLVHQVAEHLGHQAIIAGTRFELNGAEQLRAVSDALGVDDSTKQKEQSVLSVMVANPFANTNSGRGSYIDFFNEIGPTHGLMLSQAAYWRYSNGYDQLESHISVGTNTGELHEYGGYNIDSHQPVVNLAIRAAYNQALKNKLKTFYASLLPYGEQDNTSSTQADELANPPRELWRYINDPAHSDTMPTVPITYASLSVGQLESGPWYSGYIGSRIRQTYKLNKVGDLVLKKEL